MPKGVDCSEADSRHERMHRLLHARKREAAPSRLLLERASREVDEVRNKGGHECRDRQSFDTNFGFQKEVGHCDSDRHHNKRDHIRGRPAPKR